MDTRDSKARDSKNPPQSISVEFPIDNSTQDWVPAPTLQVKLLLVPWLQAVFTKANTVFAYENQSALTWSINILHWVFTRNVFLLSNDFFHSVWVHSLLSFCCLGHSKDILDVFLKKNRCSSVSVVSDLLWPYELKHSRLLCPSLSPGFCSNSCLLSRWCHWTISSSVAPFSCPQSFPASGSFSVSWLFASGSLSVELQHQSIQWILEKNDFLYFWLCWVFVAAGATLLLWCTGFSLPWHVLFWSTGSGAQAQ